MLFLPRAVKVYVATAPCNLRRSFDGLSNEVRAVLAMDPLSGHVFVFLNRRKPPVSGKLSPRVEADFKGGDEQEMT
jgi:transposase